MSPIVKGRFDHLLRPTMEEYANRPPFIPDEEEHMEWISWASGFICGFAAAFALATIILIVKKHGNRN